MKIQKAAEVICKTCMAIKPEEKVLIITDSEMIHIAEVIEKEAIKITNNVEFYEREVGSGHGEEPKYELANKMLDKDVIIMPTTHSMSHTEARRKASEKGARIASMPGITKDAMERCIDIDYYSLSELHRYLREILVQSEEIRIVTDRGTDLRTSIHNIRGMNPGLYVNRGDFGNLPTGEVDSGVKERKTSGRVVVDASFGGLGKLDSPITIEIEDGYAVSIQGNFSYELKKMLDRIGEEAYKIAELGIGTNPEAIVTGNILEDEKAKGTCHIALGNDLTYGGTNDVPIHLDGIIRNPTIFVDEKKIMERGEFML